MPAIDWTNQGLVLVLATLGLLLIVLAVVLSFLPAARLKGLALAVGIGGGLAAGTALGLHLIPAAPPVVPGKPAESPPPVPHVQAAPAATSQQALDRFRKATPAERMVLVARLPDSAAAWYTVQRGDVASLVERGSLESADNADVVVKVHAQKPGSPATTIRKILVDDGAMVKKGQLLVELEDAELQNRLKVQKSTVEQKKADLIQVQKQAEIDVEQAELALEAARHQLTLAERDLKAYTGSDAERKKGLELQVKQARLLVKNRALQETTTKARTEAARRAAQAVLDDEIARVKERETDIANCKLVAPRDGLVIYYVPEQIRFGAPFPLVAPGGPVREGQKLLSIPDLSKMQVHTRIHEALIALVRRDQTASVRVDAFPGQTIAGKVARISQVGENQGNVKVYPVAIALADNKLGLKPGMSAEVRIQMEPRRNVLRVPGSALSLGGKVVCFVKSGEEIQERPVMTGLSDIGFIEISSGLQEGDQVLRDPRAVAGRLAGLPEVRGRGRPAP